MNYGLQMYSIRDVTPEDMEGALRRVAEMGYRYVEFAGFFGKSAEQLKTWMDAFGLICTGTHSGSDDLAPERIADTIAYHQALGCENYIIPGADLSTKEKLDRFIDAVNAAQPILEEAGIRLHYHNHSHEFFPNQDGLYIHEELEKRTSMFFEIDTFWAFHAGKDPIAMLQRLKDRISVIHLKDGLLSGEGRSLGLGEAPVKAVREYAIRNGLIMIVESETLDPDGLSEVGRCIDFLKACDAEDGN